MTGNLLNVKSKPFLLVKTKVSLVLVKYKKESKAQYQDADNQAKNDANKIGKSSTTLCSQLLDNFLVPYRWGNFT